MQLLVKEIKDAIAILHLDRVKTSVVANRVDARKWAWVILAVPPILDVFLASASYPSGVGSIFTSFVFWPIMLKTASLLAAIFGMSYLAEKYFKGGNAHWPFFTVLAYSSVFLWLTPVASLLELLHVVTFSLSNLIWSAGLILVFVVAYNYLIHERHLAQRDAALTVIGGVLTYFVLQQILGNILVGPYFRVLQ